MSADRSSFADGPAPQLRLGEFPDDPETLIHNYRRAFWESGPIAIWREKASETLGALAAGTDAVILSGRYGTGKTLQFSMFVERNLGGNAYYIADAGDFASTRSVPEPIVILDEMSGVVTFGDEKVDATLEKLADKQAVLIFPGPTKAVREGLTAKLIKRASTVVPTMTFHELGDVSKTSVDADKAALAVRALGGTLAAAELVEATPALRGPRLFQQLTFEGLHMLQDTFTEQDIVHAITDLTLGSYVKRVYQWQLLYTNLAKGLNSQDYTGRHPLFDSSSVSTDETVALYELVGAKLPDPSEFDIEKLTYDPYHKE